MRERVPPFLTTRRRQRKRGEFFFLLEECARYVGRASQPHESASFWSFIKILSAAVASRLLSRRSPSVAGSRLGIIGRKVKNNQALFILNTDRTVYGAASASASSFVVHHTQQISMAAVMGDAENINKQARNKRKDWVNSPARANWVKNKQEANGFLRSAPVGGARAA